MRKRTIKSPPLPRPKSLPKCFDTIKSEDFRPKMTHEELQNKVVKCAKLNGFKAQYWWRSMHSPKGFLDLVLVRAKDRRVLMVELKSESDNLTPEQREWYEIWQQIPTIEVYIWKPAQWYDDTILKILT